MYHPQALALFPSGHCHRSSSLDSHVRSLQAVGKDGGSGGGDHYYRETLGLYPPAHPDRLRALKNHLYGTSCKLCMSLVCVALFLSLKAF